MDLSKLKEPFEEHELEWRAQNNGGTAEKPWVRCVCYIDNRAIMNRLDAVVGPENWRNEFKPWVIGSQHGVLCGLSIRCVRDCECGDEGDWITKWDGADPSDIEPIKGGLSDSMKRAAVQWGIGRYLYELEADFARIVEKQKGAKPVGKSAPDKWWLPPVLPASALPKKEPAATVRKASPVSAPQSPPAPSPPTTPSATAEAKAEETDARTAEQKKMQGPPTPKLLQGIKEQRERTRSIDGPCNFVTYAAGLQEYNRLKALPAATLATPATPEEPATATSSSLTS